jgi:hypothetical protein
MKRNAKGYHFKRAWRLWCLALGQKASKNEKEADIVALVRTAIFFSYLTTNIFIITNAWVNLTTPRSPGAPCSSERILP